MRSRLASALTAALLALVATGCPEDGDSSPALQASPDTTPPDVAQPADTSAEDVAAADTPVDAESPDTADTPADGGGDADAPVDLETSPPPGCIPAPTAAALLPPGLADDGTRIAVGGRGLTPAGDNRILAGFPTDLLVHPKGHVAYVSSAGRDDHRLFVLDLATREVIQDLDRGKASFGLALTPGGGRLFASGGKAQSVTAYDVAADGTLTAAGTVAVGGYPAGIAVAPDGARIYVGLLTGSAVVEVDAVSLERLRTLDVPHGAWDLAVVGTTGELYVSDLEGDTVMVVDLASGAVVSDVLITSSPAGLLVTPDGSRVLVAVSGGDAVAAIDTATRTVTAFAVIGFETLTDEDGDPLPNGNVNALGLDAAAGRLYVSRGADNAVSVLNAADLEPLGAIPTSWYPTAVGLATDQGLLVVAEGKGGGTGPNEGQSAKSIFAGSVTVVELATLDLEKATQQALASYLRPRAVFPFECAGNFPVPTSPDRVSPIEHVVLVVKENKTFDCVLGDLDPTRHNVDPSLVRWGEEFTPNLHALARAFSVSDAFFVEAPNSDVGHILLTATHMTEYAERVWIEGVNDGWQIGDAATPDVGNFFTHVLDHGVDLRIYGEIVGLTATGKTGAVVAEHTDVDYPGGPFYNNGVNDVLKAQYVAERIQEGELAAFTYVLLPNDHTVGTRAGQPTPESMVASNDDAVGILVDALTHSPFWEKTAIFITQDDPQGCEDHVDALRSLLVVVSPYARRGYVSHVHASFMSLFATMERILGIPPMGRADAGAAPLWDMFALAPDPAPFVARARRVPVDVNPGNAPGARQSARMDFRGPDRSPELASLLDAYRLWRMGRISRTEAERRIQAGGAADPRYAERAEESEDETRAFDRAWARYQGWRRSRGLPAHVLPALGPERTAP